MNVRGVYGALTLGVPVTVTVRPRLVAVSGLPPLAEISAGAHTTCARTIKGDVYCWGADGAGSTLLPKLVTGFAAPVARVIAGAMAACAILTDGHATAGDLVRVRIEDAHGWDLAGAIVEPAPAAVVEDRPRV